MLRIVSMISGGGSTNLAVLKAQEVGQPLHGLVETVAIVSSDPDAEGIEKAVKAGFDPNNIRVVKGNNPNLWQDLLNVLNWYSPDFFHQAGWMPLTPHPVLKCHRGLNQHLGPGGKRMYGVRRLRAHKMFCEAIGENIEIPIFCQHVAPDYDEGDAVFLEYDSFMHDETPEEAAKRLLDVEHRVQILALLQLALGIARVMPLPKIARNPKEEAILKEIIQRVE